MKKTEKENFTDNYRENHSMSREIRNSPYEDNFFQRRNDFNTIL